MLNKPNKIIVHHTAASSPDPQFAAIDSWHKDRDFPRSSLGYYVGYHYVIERDGQLKTARAEWEEGAHTVGQNTQSIGVCLVGNFDNEDPTAQQKATLGDLLHSLCARHNIEPHDIWPHRSYAAKSCYGRRLGNDWARGVYFKHMVAYYQAQFNNLEQP